MCSRKIAAEICPATRDGMRGCPAKPAATEVLSHVKRDGYIADTVMDHFAPARRTSRQRRQGRTLHPENFQVTPPRELDLLGESVVNVGGRSASTARLFMPEPSGSQGLLTPPSAAGQLPVERGRVCFRIQRCCLRPKINSAAELSMFRIDF